MAGRISLVSVGSAELLERERELEQLRALIETAAALTPSELRVARMAAEGMSNREIAQALFVTLRTVQVHLTHTYQSSASRRAISCRPSWAGE